MHCEADQYARNYACTFVLEVGNDSLPTNKISNRKLFSGGRKT